MADTGWLDRAEEELTRATRDSDAGDIDAAVQHSCQAVECALKAIIVSEKRSLPPEVDDHDYQSLQSHANAHLSAHEDIIAELTGVHERVVSPDMPDHEIEDSERLIADITPVVEYAESYVTP